MNAKVFLYVEETCYEKKCGSTLPSDNKKQPVLFICSVLSGFRVRSALFYLFLESDLLILVPNTCSPSYKNCRVSIAVRK